MSINPAEILMQYLCLLFALCIHEAAHGWVAERCGDPTARMLGRVTLNPIPHIDVVGTVIMPLAMLLSSSMVSGRVPLLGWAKPVPYNPRNLHNMRRDPVLVALAGPAANLLTAVVTLLVLKGILVLGPEAPSDTMIGLANVLMTLLFVNIALMVFNLIPLPPLDGSAVLEFLLPPRKQEILHSIAPFSIILLLLFAPYVVGGPLRFIYGLVHGFLF